MPLVSVIIPAWNLWDMTRDCLESLARHSPPGAIEVVVADNGSTDATATELAPLGRRLFGEYFQVVRLERNLGFSVGCNSGARAGRGGLLFFLNNDTLVTNNWLPPLLDALRGPAAPGMVGPLLLFPGIETVQHCGVAFEPNLEVQHLYFHFPGDHPVVRAPRKVQALSGAALLLDRELFFRVGGFCEDYQNGFEDLDLCCELRKLGLRLACVPQSVIYHLTSQTPGRNAHDSQNARLINERQPGGFTPDAHLHALADGFMPAVSPGLEFYLRLPEEREAALTRAFSANFDPERCARRLHAEPLWLRGHGLLAEHLESAGFWAEATEIRLQQARFFPLPDIAEALAVSAAKAGLAETAAAAAEQANEQRARAADLPALAAQAQALLRWARRAEDKTVLRLYGDWAKTRGVREE